MALPGAGFSSSLTLGRVRQKCAAFSCCCIGLQIRRDLCLACRHCSGFSSGWRYRVCPAVSCTVEGSKLHSVHVRRWCESALHCSLSGPLRSSKCPGMHCEGVPVACRPRPNAPSRVSTWSGDRSNFVHCDGESWQRSPRQCLCRSRAFLGVDPAEVRRWRIGRCHPVGPPVRARNGPCQITSIPHGCSNLESTVLPHFTVLVDI